LTRLDVYSIASKSSEVFSKSCYRASKSLIYRVAAEATSARVVSVYVLEHHPSSSEPNCTALVQRHTKIQPALALNEYPEVRSGVKKSVNNLVFKNDWWGWTRVVFPHRIARVVPYKHLPEVMH
jgi:hypothetical protein